MLNNPRPTPHARSCTVALKAMLLYLLESEENLDLRLRGLTDQSAVLYEDWYSTAESFRFLGGSYCATQFVYPL